MAETCGWCLRLAAPPKCAYCGTQLRPAPSGRHRGRVVRVDSDHRWAFADFAPERRVFIGRDDVQRLALSPGDEIEFTAIDDSRGRWPYANDVTRIGETAGG